MLYRVLMVIGKTLSRDDVSCECKRKDRQGSASSVERGLKQSQKGEGRPHAEVMKSIRNG